MQEKGLDFLLRTETLEDCLVQLQPPAPTLNLRIKPKCTKEDGAIPGVGGRPGSDNIV